MGLLFRIFRPPLGGRLKVLILQYTRVYANTIQNGSQSNVNNWTYFKEKTICGNESQDRGL